VAGRILVIEDNAINLALVTFLLKSHRFTVLTATDGLVGIELAEQGGVDLIICDVQLPGLSGYQVAARLKAHPQLKLIPIIAVTALAMVGDREKLLAAGFDGYISKPIDPKCFVQQVTTYLPA
jgi:CheY-like chemotaxis protein